MKAIILKEDDLEDLLVLVDREPRYGNSGGSSRTITDGEGGSNKTLRSPVNRQEKKPC